MSNSKVVKSVAGILALGLTGTYASAAVTVTAGTAKYGQEFIAANQSSLSTLYSVNAGSSEDHAPRFDSTVDYLTGDVVTVTLGGTAGAQFSTSSLQNATLVCNSDGTPDIATEAASAATSAGSSNTYVFTLTSNCSLATDAAARVFLVGADLVNSSLTTLNGTITISVGVTRSGATIDSTAAAGTVATLEREFTAAVTTPFDGVVSHQTGNKTFVGAETDAAVITVTNQDMVGTTDSLGTATSFTSVLTGNWLIADTDGNGQCTDAELGTGDGRITAASSAGGTVTATISSDCTALTLVADATAAGMGGDSGTPTITVTVDTDGLNDNATTYSAGYLIPGTITGTGVLQFTPDNGSATTFNPVITPGAFTSEVSTVFVPWMPAGPTTSQSLWITNNSNASGSVTITGRNQNGVSCSAADMGGAIAVGANRTVSLGNAIVNAITNCWGGFGVTQKFFLTLQTNLPDEAIEVFTQFNVGGNDRGFIMNSSNGRSATATGMGNANSTGRN